MTEVAQRPVLTATEVQKFAMETAAKGAEEAVNSALTAPQKAVAEIAAKNLSANRAREAALTVTTGLTHTADAEQIEGRLFLSEVKADGTRVGTATETARQAEVSGLRSVYTKLILDPGSLTPIEIDQLKPQVQAMILANSADFPSLQVAYETAPGTFDEDLIKNLMKSPQVARKLATEMNRIYDLGAKNLPDITGIEEKMLQAQQSIDSLMTERTNLTNKKTRINAATVDETNFITNPYNYVDATGATVTTPNKAAALSEIDQSLQASGSADPGVVGYAKNIAELRAFEEKINTPGLTVAEKNIIRKDISDRRQWTVKAENDSQYGRLCKTYKTLTEEQRDIETRIAQSQDVVLMSNIDKDIQTKTNEIVQKTKSVDDSRLEKNTKVGEIESAMKKAIAEAAAEHITEEKNAVFTNYPEYEQQAMTALEEKARHIMHEALQSRYFKMEAVPADIWQRVKKEIGLNFKDAFRPVFNHAIATTDVKNFCSYGFNAETFIKNVGMAGSPPLTSDEMDVLIKDPKFVKEQMSIATQRSLRAYEWKNGMGDEMIQGLVETEWGAAALDYTIKHNESARDLTRDYEAGGGSVSRALLRDAGPGFLVKLLMFLGALGASPFVSIKKRTA